MPSLTDRMMPSRSSTSTQLVAETADIITWVSTALSLLSVMSLQYLMTLAG